MSHGHCSDVSDGRYWSLGPVDRINKLQIGRQKISDATPPGTKRITDRPAHNANTSVGRSWFEIIIKKNSDVNYKITTFKAYYTRYG